MIYISGKADSLIVEYIANKGHQIVKVYPNANVDEAISTHPDIYMCKLTDRIYFGDSSLLGPEYPSDVLYNAAAVGNYLICSRYTSKKLIEESGLIPVFVPQGYVKCNLTVIDDKHVITEDKGISKALEMLKTQTGIECLLISPHHVYLPGYKYGFIGGASGKIDNEIIFNGDLSAHPDYERIIDFINQCGLKTAFFKEYRLTDIGSIISSEK